MKRTASVLCTAVFSLLIQRVSIAQTFELLPDWPQTSGAVTAIQVDATNNVAYLGGSFTQFGGQTRTRLAAVDLTTGALLAWAPSVDGTVNDIEVVGDSVIVVGEFSSVNGFSRSNLACLDAATGALRPWAPSLNFPGNVVRTFNNIIYVGGQFTEVNGIARGRGAAFDGNDGSMTGWNPNILSSDIVRVIEPVGNNLLLAGLFTVNSGSFYQNTVLVNSVSGVPIPGWQANAIGVVIAAHVIEDEIIIVGQFTSVNGVPRQRAAAISAIDGSLLPWAPAFTHTSSVATVRTITTIPGGVIIGGLFTHVNGVPHSGLALLDPSTGELLTSDFSVNSRVNSVARFDNRLLVGGLFTGVTPGGARAGLAAFQFCYESAWYADSDGDGFGDPDVMIMSCTAPLGYVTDNTDCDDTDLDIQGPTTWFADTDGDGYGDPNNTALACSMPSGFVSNALDCDDDEFTVFPGAACDDGDPLTYDDVIEAYPDCGCMGQLGITVEARAFLQGPYSVFSGMMADDLRVAGLIPLTEPYTGLGYDPVGAAPQSGATINASVLDQTPIPLTDIVDWIILELRDASDGSIRVSTRYALVQRYGLIVDLDGVSPVRFAAPPGDYRVAVLHRNHKGLVTANAVALPGPLVDFTSASLQVVGGASARADMSFVQAMINGDVTFNDVVSYTGLGNDRDPILSAIGGVVPTNSVAGYRVEDVNMDGIVRYTGAGNDRDPILSAVGGTPTSVQPNTYLHTTP